jgi:hypothetical protein
LAQDSRPLPGEVIATTKFEIYDYPGGYPEPKGVANSRPLIGGTPSSSPQGAARANAIIDPKIVEDQPLLWCPNIAQQGRPVEIHGSFDGSLENTTLTVGGQAATKLTESPRRLVFLSPTDVTGPVEMAFKEGNVETKRTYRNIGVRLSAPKTSLLKGESTTLKVEISGLQGIKEPVPLTLESQGVITMQGGVYQPLVIQPSQVGADGRYSTTREITGVQAGGWTATATVQTGPAARGNLAKPLTQNEKDALEEEAHNMTDEQLDARLADLGHRLEAEGRDNGTDTDEYKRLKEELDIFNKERRKRK